MKMSASSIITRWFIALQELDFKVVFVPGKDNGMADALSRLCPNLKELALDFTPPLYMGPNLLLAALERVHPPSEDQLECIEQCHNTMIGHGGCERTLDKLLALGHY